MEVIIEPDPEAASHVAARLVMRQVREKPRSVLGLATGKTPQQLYRLLVEACRNGSLNLDEVTTFNLDEYVGLAREHPGSYYRFMEENLFGKVSIPPERRHIPDGMAGDIPGECASYEEAIKEAGGIDLQVLGLGREGHIGFNEPGSSLASRTRIKTLTEETRRDNAFGEDRELPPRHVITMGLGTIMESRTCVLLAFGPGKAEAVRRVVEGPVSAFTPGSILQFHPRAKVILDEPAAAALERHDYYRFVYRNKPEWQADL